MLKYLEYPNVILTPNKRLARHLTQQFAQAQIATEQRTWLSSKILPLSTWLETRWHECTDPRVLLNPQQEKLLWRNCIVQELGNEYANLSAEMQQANELINLWQLTTNNWQDLLIEDTAAFIKVRGKFLHICKQRQYIVASQLPELLSQSWSAIKSTLPDKIDLIGFEELTPSQQQLIAALKQSGSTVTSVDPNQYPTATVMRVAFPNSTVEITTMARWAKQQLADNPKAIITCVVPNLHAQRELIISNFQTVFASTEAINFSAGIPLGSTPIINAALTLLALHEPFDQSSLSTLLQLPFWRGSSSEHSARTWLDVLARSSNKEHFYLENLIALDDNNAKKISLLINALEKWRQFLRQNSTKKLSCSLWAQNFAHCLQLLGWPGDELLTLSEAQAVRHLSPLLAKFAQLDLIMSAPISRGVAVALLSDLASDCEFQGSSNKKAQINILGLLEAAGSNFDYLWVMGMDNTQWPTPCRPNPFIPPSIQRSHQLPHASPARELHFCEALTARLKHSAPNIIFSYTNYCEGRQLLPSALIADLPEIPITQLPLAPYTPAADKIFSTRTVQHIVDSSGPAWLNTEKIVGGNRILQQQSLCPFLAFAAQRLQAQALPTKEFGVTRQERGILIHTILQQFWQQVSSHANLVSLAPLALEQQITMAMDIAMAQVRIKPTMQATESLCLKRLVHDWLELERAREPFTVVATEQTLNYQCGNLKLKLRIDRIDRLANGELLLIDYKTGKTVPSSTDWFHDDGRLYDTQLPLYCLALPNIRQFALAQISSEKLGFKTYTIAELSRLLPKSDLISDTSWQELVAYWQTTLTKLADDFSSGAARVAPLDPEVCARCSLQLLCRIKKQD